MQTKASTLFNQNQISQQLGYQKNFDLEASTNVTLKTEEGDVVSFSFEDTFEFSESGRQTHFEGEEELQELSVSALTAFQYYLSVQGDLNGEELAAIQSLTEALRPVASSFFTEDGFSSEVAVQVLSDSMGDIQELDVNLKKTVSVYEHAFTQVEEVGSEQLIQDSENIENPQFSFDTLRDFKGLVESVVNSVFRPFEKSFLEDTLLEKFSDFKNLLTQQVLGVFRPELPPEPKAVSADETFSDSAYT